MDYYTALRRDTLTSQLAGQSQRLFLNIWGAATGLKLHIGSVLRAAKEADCKSATVNDTPQVRVLSGPPVKTGSTSMR